MLVRVGESSQAQRMEILLEMIAADLCRVRNRAGGHRRRALLLLLCAVVYAQDPGVLRVSTHLVQIEVVVTDSKANPVEGLTRDDFVVTENGKVQKIATFSMNGLGGSPNTRQNLPPGIFTNRADLRGGAPSSITVILLDMLNTSFADQARCREQLIQFLREQVRPEDRLAIYTLGSELKVLNEFTNDANEIVKALARHKPRVSTELERSEPETYDPEGGDAISAEMQDFLLKADATISAHTTLDRLRLTTAALLGIANRVAGLPGRKNLVWVSEGFPVSIGVGAAGYRSFEPEIRNIARAMNSGGLAIYPVDAQGLTVLPGYGASIKSPPPPSAAFVSDAYRHKRETMRTLAERTGGRAFYDTNDIQGAIRKAVDDSRLTYVLGYYPSHDKWDGHFQEVKVKVSRHGTTARYRNGYFALPDQLETEKDRDAGVAGAIASPLEQTGLRMVIGVARNMPAPGRLTLRLTIDPAEIQFVKQDGRWKGLLDIAYVQLSGPKKSVEIARDRLKLNLLPETYATVQAKGLVVEKELDMTASRYRLKVVARAVSTGVTGSVEIPMDP
jgi:VWFA-related protein